jgi:hypothetical protein
MGAAGIAADVLAAGTAITSGRLRRSMYWSAGFLKVEPRGLEPLELAGKMQFELRKLSLRVVTRAHGELGICLSVLRDITVLESLLACVYSSGREGSASPRPHTARTRQDS